jgi:hypothetical protein
VKEDCLDQSGRPKELEGRTVPKKHSTRKGGNSRSPQHQRGRPCRLRWGRP